MSDLICPECQSNDIETTTVGFAPGTPDPNKATCLACGWKGSAELCHRAQPDHYEMVVQVLRNGQPMGPEEEIDVAVFTQVAARTLDYLGQNLGWPRLGGLLVQTAAVAAVNQARADVAAAEGKTPGGLILSSDPREITDLAQARRNLKGEA